MRTAAIRQELLTSNEPDLQQRRKVMLFSTLGIIDFAFISLYQSGTIDRMPELPFDRFDSNRVNAAPEAYKMGAPDGTISLWLYATTMVLATYGGTKASGRPPLADAALGIAVAANTAGALYYLGDMLFRQRKICPYCLVGAGLNIASAIVLRSPVVAAFKTLWRR